ncbi:hypothetical protein L486_03816 [Kwoniella mangroviensis CBS 10435]|uniref:Uncharacterized protein n=1 Tax=Kwoniella mangroviensis CBS 10435 TaxID=1331196 RepID=A0A1B9IUY4_9TREE|nr:hypothetical protein L486_03816 [Kwoniella mangroviensis CBS 10435]
MNLSQEDEQSIRDDLTFLRSGWRTNLKPKSPFEQYKSAQEEIQRHFIKYLTRCSTLIADQHLEKRNIQTRVQRLNDIDQDLKRYLAINHDITDSDTDTYEETLKIACSSISKPSMWMIMGNSPLGYSRAITEYTKEVKLLPEFGTKWDMTILPSTNADLNKKACDELGRYREKARSYIELKMLRMDFATTHDEMEDSMKPDHDFFDCDSNPQLKDERMESYVQNQYDTIKERETDLQDIVQHVKRRCKKSEDNDLFEVHAMSGIEYSKYDPDSARKLGYLNYHELPRVLRDEFEQVSDELEHRRKNPKYQQSLSDFQKSEIKRFLEEESERLDPSAWKGGSPA